MRACIEAHKGDCSGDTEYRESLSGTGTAIPRCDRHWAERLAKQQEHNQAYPDSSIPPPWFDAANAGEHWDYDY